MLGSSITKALQAEFRHVRVFQSVEGWGFHFLASDVPIARRSGNELARRLPEPARRDLVEWLPGTTAESLFDDLMRREIAPRTLVARSPDVPALSDDRPVNEYFAIRVVLDPDER